MTGEKVLHDINSNTPANLNLIKQ